MLQLDYRDARPIYAQIVDRFREQIIAGVLQCGDKLPSVRELACQLAINPNTIQRAYRELESGGWIATVPGKGCFVHSIPATQNTPQQALLQEFDRVTAALLASGLSREELIRHLSEGGNESCSE
jgi:GntR family transcriptional regulator